MLPTWSCYNESKTRRLIKEPCLYCSSGAFLDTNDVSSILSRCRDLGIRNIELSSGLKSGVKKLGETLLAAKDEFNLLIHNYFPAPNTPFVLNLADADEINRRRSLLFCEEAIKLSATAGIPAYSVHAGFVSSLKVNDLGKPERQNEQVTGRMVSGAKDRFYQSIELLLEKSIKYGVRLLIENNVHASVVHGSSYSSQLLLTDPLSISEFFTHFNQSNLGLLLDVAHWRVSSSFLKFDPISDLEIISKWVRQIHLSDNDGKSDSNHICRDDSWFWEPLANNLDLCSIPIVLEAYGLQDKQIFKQLELISLRCRSLSYQTSKTHSNRKALE